VKCTYDANLVTAGQYLAQIIHLLSIVYDDLTNQWSRSAWPSFWFVITVH